MEAGRRMRSEMGQQGSIRVIGYLGRALSYELSAVQQYMSHAAMCDTWELGEASQRWRQEAAEELAHAERIVQRMLALGVAPNASQLRPVRVGGNLAELIACNIHMEGDIVRLYSDAVVTCLRSGDQQNGDFFRQFLDEERQHAQELKHWYESLTDWSGA